MDKWNIPNWGEPWEPEFEVSFLKDLASIIEKLDNSIVCEPDFETEGCAFIQLYKNKLNIGRICLTKHEDGTPFYSGYFGVEEDEFHGFNQQAIAHAAVIYTKELPDD